MMASSTEKFCLKWNDFESNVSAAFKDLREEKDFFDVTLACEDSQIEAHKVILAACSPFFKKILKRNPHQHPLLYLKGIKSADLAAIMSFIYMGEVNVAQEDLNTFLAIAEELHVKGLTQGGEGQNHKPKQTLPSKVPEKKESFSSNFSQNKRLKPVSHPEAADSNNDNDIEEIVQVKPEPNVPSTQVQQNVEHEDYTYATDGAVAVHDSADYGGYEGYEDDPGIMDTNVYDTSLDKEHLDNEIGQHMQKLEFGNWRCAICGWETKARARLWEHIESSHIQTNGYTCDICEKFCPSKNAFKVHKTRYHRNVV